MNELFYSLQREFASRAAQIAPTWEEIVASQAQTSTSQEGYNFGGVNSFNNVAYVSQLKIYMSSYNHSGKGTLDNSPYGNPSIPSQQGSSGFYYQEQFQQPSDEELFRALKDEINRDNEALQIDC